MILELIDEAVTSGARQRKACEVMGLSVRTVQRWRKPEGEEYKRKGARRRPANALSEQERQEVLTVANSKEYRDSSPQQIVPTLAEKGEYIASESSFYLMDMWSRKIVGWTVEECESKDLAAAMLVRACLELDVEPEGIVLHSDNGGPMKGSTMLATMQRLGIVASFSRPHVSDDNPYSESLFRTLKYRPEYPGKPFATIEEARAWVEVFVLWFNTEHLHSSIRFVTPDDRHFGREQEVLARRRVTYEQACQLHPERWSGAIRNWSPVGAVYLNPEE